MRRSKKKTLEIWANALGPRVYGGANQMHYGNDTFQSVRDSISQKVRVEQKNGKKNKAGNSGDRRDTRYTKCHSILLCYIKKYMFYGACTRRH